MQRALITTINYHTFATYRIKNLIFDAINREAEL
jgi:hypothetical protein